MANHIYLRFILIWLPAMSVQAQLATANENGLAFGHAHLNVPDVEDHLAIWVEHFNGELISVGSDIGVKFPNMLLMFNEKDPSTASVNTVMHHLGFKVRNIDTFIEHWEAAGFEMGRIFTGREGYTNAYITLPGGVEVELQEDRALYREFSSYHIHYSTEAYETLLDWYVDMFDLKIQPRGAIPSATDVPGQNMSFGLLGDGPFVASAGAAIDHVGFEVENLEAFCEALAEKGVVFDVAYHWDGEHGVALASFTDPLGVLIELTEGLRNY